MTRFAIDLGFTQRPLFVAALWSLLTWQWQPAISVGIFFELLWLDLFPAGTFIPPNGLLAVTATLTLLASLDWPSMRLTALSLLVALPLAYLGSAAESWYRKRQNLSYTALVIWNRRSRSNFFSPERLVYRGIFEQFCLNIVFFAVLLLPLQWCVTTSVQWFEEGAQPTWPMLWIAAALGGVLSLRIRSAYAVSLACLGVGVLAGF